MKKQLMQFLLLVICLGVFANIADAQKTTRKAAKRNTTKKTTRAKTSTPIQPTDTQQDSLANGTLASAPAVVSDSLPLKIVKKSLRKDEAVESIDSKDRTPLAYEYLRADDAVYRHKIWREIDTREKINLPFRYAATDNNGDQRFISILLQAVQDSAVTVFSNVDDRFTTPMTKSEVAAVVSGEEIDVPIIDSNGVVTGTKKMRNDINLDSFYKFHIKEEVIFDKESSRLFWRILGIAPVKNVITSLGVDLGESELFWVYYPDMRPIFANHEVYNGKNFGAKMYWDDLFEGRMFYGRIIKSTMDNPYDLQIKDYKGLSDNKILQLLEGENIKEKIFNYEQDLWSY